MPKLEKGQHVSLNVTKQAHHRIFCGLGWDPKTQAKFTEKLTAMVGGKKTYHDLDLSVFMYGEDRNFISSVCAKTEQSLNELGQIYHSGDNVEGVGDGDDEQISVELRNLNPKIHHIVFVAAIRSGHSFNEILSPEIRLADGYSGHNFLDMALNHEESKGHSQFVFCHVYRAENEKWMMHYIGEYMNTDDSNDWEEFFKTFLGKAI